MYKSSFITKVEAIADFKANHLPAGYLTDRPMLRMCWNDYVDALRKDGSIAPDSDWVQPAFIAR